MDDSSVSKEHTNPDTSPSSPIENSNENVEVHCDSPERPHTAGTEKTINLTSSKEDEPCDPKCINSADDAMDGGELPSNGDSVSDGYLDSEEQMIQRHMLLTSVLEARESDSVFHCKYPSCNFTSADVEVYLKHEDTHVDGGAFHCDVCNMRFTTYANMRRHRLLHLGIRPFECQHCSKRFFRKDQLMEHLVKHSKQRPFRCPFCNRSFNFRPHLKTHLSSDHTGIVLDKACRLCDFKASSPNGAKIHFAMCHLKQSPEVSDSDAGKSRDVYSSGSQVHIVPSVNGAIDLATVSQNFSFMPAHYAPFPTVTGDNVAVPGPSDLSQTASKVVRVPTPRVHIIPHVSMGRNTPIQEPPVNSRHTCISALAGSTTLISPTSCQDRACCRGEGHNQQEQLPQEGVCIKPEPPELVIDDSQNSNVQPTSTMDLTTTDIVETTFVANEEVSVPCSSEVPMRRKVHKHSSGDETSSESYQSPSNRTCLDSQSGHVPVTRNAHSCFRLRHCEESSSQRCRAFSRHTCNMYRHGSEKRVRISETDACRSVRTDHPEWMERKVFYNHATSTDSTAEILSPRMARRGVAHHNNETPCTSESRNEANYFDDKSTIAIRHIESCTLTCPFCEIIFPDQTLYLLHRSLHSEASPWKCNLCGKTCKDKYDFNSHVISKGHY